MEEQELFFEIETEMEKIKCEYLLSFTNDNKDYIVYTDNKVDEEGNLNILASSYIYKDDKLILMPISEEKMDMVDKVIEGEFNE